tara:strand:- start:183 stop:599 length:417 start_codon:yes stop_codon:yes gene_type:complete
MTSFTPNEYTDKLNDIKLIFESIESDRTNTNIDQASIQTSNQVYEENYDELVQLKNQLINDMDIILKSVNTEHDNITRYDNENEKLRTRYNDIKDKIEGSIGMQEDSQTLYNQEYYGNILILFTLIGGCVLYARIRNL